MFTTTTAKDETARIPIPEFSDDEVPADLSDQNSLRAWQTLFKKRRDWAATVWTRARDQSFAAEEYIRQRLVVEQAARVATANLESRVRSLEQKYSEARSWFEDIVKDVGAAPQTFDEDISRLSSIPSKAGFYKFFGPADTNGTKGQRRASGASSTLASLIDHQTVKKAAATSETTLHAVSKQLESLGSTVDNVMRQYGDLAGAANMNQSRSIRDDPDEPTKLLQDVEAVANKIAADCERVVGFSSADTKAPAAASKIALLHTRNFLPNLVEYSKEMQDLVRNSIEQKNASVERLVENLQLVAAGESTVAAASKSIATLAIPEEGHAAMDQVSLVARIPFSYGSLLIEAVRRHEWVEKMKRDSSALAEELAGYQDEEQRRRKRWLKAMNNILPDSAEGRVLGVEINLQGEENNWPDVTRQDVDDYIKALQTTDGMKEVAESLTQMVRELDRPTRQQVKRAKTFKMGSVHEAGFGKASLMLRGEDEMRVLKEANTKLEDESKSHKSRIRKLEDLLHRQSHVGRLSLINGSPSSQPAGPHNAGRGVGTAVAISQASGRVLAKIFDIIETCFKSVAAHGGEKSRQTHHST